MRLAFFTIQQTSSACSPCDFIINSTGKSVHVFKVFVPNNLWLFAVWVQVLCWAMAAKLMRAVLWSTLTPSG
jgi:hypothetical protein